ncbi:CARDB domain-containing protein [Salinigranum halophilum]|jgi:flagellar protein FlaG|uniref:CARDB domain-containing protein n=1 Tax=Salinigranum halophilum TaxID=2565931 RepID=UPI0010A76E14|nr:CARDB domain-containing protein [Salinigranum halophilum]
MAEISVPTLILFIASIVIAAGVAGVLIDTVSGISNAVDDRGGDVSKSIKTDAEIISDPEAGVYDETNDTLTLYVKNTGVRTLSADARTVDLFVDGRYQTAVSVSVVSSDEWTPNAVVRVVATGVTLSAGDHRVKLVVDTDEETFEFRTS